MIYDIRMVTLSTYEDYVPFARHVLRLAPSDRPGQKVVSFSLEVEPGSSELLPGADFFGNVTASVACSEAHHSFIARAAARVEVSPPPVIEGPSPTWEEVVAAALVVRDLSPEAPAHFLYPSRMIVLSDAMRDYAHQSFPPGRAVRDGVIDLMRRLHAEMTYDGDATTVSTLPDEAFALRRGVCQDYAHVMIAGLRAIG